MKQAGLSSITASKENLLRVAAGHNFKSYFRMKKTIVFVLAFTLSGMASFAQNDPSFSQYMFNEKIFNPASLSLTNTFDFSLVARQQWVGFDDAPSSQVFNASTYLQDIYGGLGLNIINDKLGYENFLTVRANYAFPVQVGVVSHLIFGLGAGIVNRTIDGTGLTYEDPNDPNGLFTKETYTRPDFSFGMEYTDPNLRMGFAVTHLHRSALHAGIDYAPRHYYMYGKYRFDNIVPKVDLEPYLLIKSNRRSTQFDINMIAYYDKQVWAGLSYRLGDAFSAMLGYAITSNIKVGYAYDYSIGVNRRYSGGSHEIMILASLGGFNKERISPNTPRIFN
jgi:type IX secretion system PorP/SprF family membrane protein